MVVVRLPSSLKLFLAGKVTVGRSGGDTRDAAGVGKREILRTAVLNQLTRRPDESPAHFLMAVTDLSQDFEKLASLTR
jgi:hypothetical protein